MSFLDQIKKCNNTQLEQYRPYLIDGVRYGWIRDEFAEVLQEWPEVFIISEQQVLLSPSLTTYQQRTDTVHKILVELHKRGVIDTWVNENYPVTNDFDAEPIMEMERAGVLYFGLLGFGVHMNGMVETDDGVFVWIATRAKDKPFYSGKLDQMVAGGQPIGLGAHENLVKECQEEANIPAELAVKADARGTINYAMHTERGLDVSSIILFDLWLPEDFTPENTDGEVDSFALVPLSEVHRLTDETELFKDNCNLVNIDLLVRSGLIETSHDDFKEIERWLYASHDQIFEGSGSA